MTTPRVNLLPHREARRERQKKVFWFMTGLSVVAGLLMIAVVWTVLQGYISNQEARNEFVRAENRKLDIQIKEIATLRAEIESLRRDVERLVTARSYEDALARLATLRGPVDAFFDQVMVNDSDAALRGNRFALLGSLRSLFTRIADLSRLPG